MVTRRMQLGPNQAIRFDKVNGTAMPVVSNVMARREAIATSLGVSMDDLLPTLAAREAQTQPLLTVASAPVHEVVMTDAIEVSRALPQIVHSPLDGGPYISAGIFIAKHLSNPVISKSNTIH